MMAVAWAIARRLGNAGWLDVAAAGGFAVLACFYATVGTGDFSPKVASRGHGHDLEPAPCRSFFFSTSVEPTRRSRGVISRFAKISPSVHGSCSLHFRNIWPRWLPCFPCPLLSLARTLSSGYGASKSPQRRSGFWRWVPALWPGSHSGDGCQSEKLPTWRATRTFRVTRSNRTTSGMARLVRLFSLCSRLAHGVGPPSIVPCLCSIP